MQYFECVEPTALALGVVRRARGAVRRRVAERAVARPGARADVPAPLDRGPAAPVDRHR